MDDGDVLTEAGLVGRSINLLSSGGDAFDLKDVIDRSGKSVIVHQSKNTKPVRLPGSEKDYELPENISLNMGGGTHYNDLICETDTEIIRQLEVDASVSFKYMGISVKASAQYNYRNTVKSSTLYGVYCLDQQAFSLFLEGNEKRDARVKPSLIEAAQKLPSWDPSNPEVWKIYTEFFESWGTHVIEECFFGSRYQLTVEHDTQSNETKESFQTHVKAEYEGIVSGEVEGGIKNSEEYKQYLSRRATRCFVRGGPPSKRAILAKSPSDADAYKYRSSSLDTEGWNDLNNARVDSIGNLLKKSSIPGHNEVSDRLINGLDFLSKMCPMQGYVAALGVPSVLYFSLEGKPGLKVTGTSSMGVVEQVSPASIKVQVRDGYQKESESLSADIIVVAPPLPVDVKVYGEWDGPMGRETSTATLSLNSGETQVISSGNNVICVPNLTEPGTHR